MTILEKLIDCSKKDIKIFKNCNNQYCVNFENATVFDGIADIGVFGRGATIEEATRDYIKQISGKKLRFGNSKEFVQFIFFVE